MLTVFPIWGDLTHGPYKLAGAYSSTIAMVKFPKMKISSWDMSPAVFRGVKERTLGERLKQRRLWKPKATRTIHAAGTFLRLLWTKMRVHVNPHPHTTPSTQPLVDRTLLTLPTFIPSRGTYHTRTHKPHVAPFTKEMHHHLVPGCGIPDALRSLSDSLFHPSENKCTGPKPEARTLPGRFSK